MYDFTKELKKKYEQIKDLPPSEVGYTLSYTPWVLAKTREMYIRFNKRYEFNDLLSVIIIACQEAELKFDASKQSMFTSYAAKFVEGAVISYTSNLSTTQVKLLKRIQEFTEHYFIKHNSYPAKHIILETLKVSEQRFENLLAQNAQLQYIENEDDFQEVSDIDSQIIVDEILSVIRYIDVDYNGMLESIYIDEQEERVVAAKLGLTTQVFNTRLAEAVEVLKEELKARGLSIEEVVYA